MRQAVVVCCVALVQGCAAFLPAPVPMASLKDAHPGRAKCLLVFLPGAGDHADAFSQEQLVQAVRAKPLSVDIVSADATLGYYLRGVLAERLDADVVSPARAAGAQETWVAGMSMGGFGSLFYAQQRPGQVQGVLAMSPFLGSAAVTKEIRDAGGLARWQAPPPAPSTSDNYDRQLWRWLQEVTVKGASGPEIYLGWGDAEALAADDALLGAAVPADHVFHAPGKHEWNTWRSILAQWLERSRFAQRCAE